MANKYAGTKTEKNLWEAFAGESMARNKYTFFASTARKQGFEQIAAIFEETANNERAHAKMWFNELGLEERPLKTLRMQQKAKTWNGPTCMTAWPKKRMKKASMIWQKASVR